MLVAILYTGFAKDATCSSEDVALVVMTFITLEFGFGKMLE